MTRPAATVDRRHVLILTREGTQRDPIRRALMQEDFKPDFCTSAQAAHQLLAASNMGFFLHDWDAIERSQAIDLQRRFNRMDSYAQLIRVVYAQELDAGILSLANDANIRRVLTYATAKLNLGAELKMLTASESAMSELQRKVRLLSQGSVGYQQEYVDKLVAEAFAAHAHDPLVKIEYASLCYRQGQLTEAEQFAGELLMADGHNVRALSLLSRIRMKQGRMEDAVRLLEHANVLSPRHCDRLSQLADTLSAMGRKSEAAKYYQESLAIDPDHQDSQRGLGILKLEQGDVNAAMQLLNASMSEEEVAGYFNNVAVQATRQGRFEEGLRLYQTALRALKTDRLKPLIHFNIGLAYRRLGQVPEARRAFELSLGFDPTYVKAKQQLDELAQQEAKALAVPRAKQR